MLKSSASPAPPSRFGFSVDAVTHRPAEEPALRIELVRERFDRDQRVDFTPLRMPDRARIISEGPLARALHRAQADLSLRLAAGTHALMLPEPPGAALRVLVQPESGARIQVDIERDRDQRTVLRSASATFTPPIRLVNPIAALGTLVQRLDHPLRALWQQWVPRLQQLQSLRSMFDLATSSADLAVDIELRAIRLSSWRDHRGIWIKPQLAGKLRLLDRLTLPLDLLQLPTFALPRVPADLDSLWELLHDGAPDGVLAELLAPLRDLVPLESALSFLLGLVAGGTGSVSAELQLPPFSLNYATGDGTERTLDLSILGAQRLDAPLAIKRERDTISLATEGAKLTGRDSLAELAGTLQLQLGHSAQGSTQPPKMRATLQLAPQSTIAPLAVRLSQRNALVKGQACFDLLFEQPQLEGGLQVQSEGSAWRFGLGESARLKTPLSSRNSSLLIETADLRVDTAIGGELELSLSQQQELRAPSRQRQLVFGIDFSGQLEHAISARLTPLPELELHDGALSGAGRTQTRLHLAPRFSLVGANMPRVDLDGSSLDLSVQSLHLSVDGRELRVPKGTVLTAAMLRGGLTPSELQPAELRLSWDLQGLPLVLATGEAEASVLANELRAGELSLLISETGRVRFSGERAGLYGVEYFNALLNPAENLEAWVNILRSDDAIRHVLGALELFSPEFAERLTDLRLLAMAARTIFRREGILEVRDFLPRPAIARTLSLLLVGDRSLEAELLPIIEQVTEGHGIPLAEAKHLLQRELGEFDVDFEINIALNWLSLVLRAGDTIPPARPSEEAPLASGRAESFTHLPSALQIYEAIEGGSIDRTFAARLAELAPELSMQELAALLAAADTERWGRETVQQLHRVHTVKQHVTALGKAYGGIDHIAQPFFIGAFLGQALGPIPGVNSPIGRERASWPPPCACGPAEIATLLAAGLATPRQGPRTELNNRLLLEHLRRSSPRFVRDVMIELSGQSRLALSGILFAFLEQDQDEVVEPLDLPGLLESKLALDVPRHDDYLAGGRRARHSYYEALHHLAEEILVDADDYWARKEYLQRVRHPVPKPPTIVHGSKAARLDAKACEAIAKADALAAECCFDEARVRGPRRRAIHAYEAAFAACAELLAEKPRAFQLPWLKAFWARNENALRVLSVVRAYQDDLDDVRPWLHYYAEQPSFAHEQALLVAAVQSVFFYQSDQRALLQDPLVRLLLDPASGSYDLSVVSCMGVITEGADGRELEDAFFRLHLKRGVRVLRAPTGTGRSLEYNARRIIDTIATLDGPYGIIGYSQGCANALLAESLLHSGSPAEQRHLDRLVCRNLLFSAANGSAHGSSAMVKFIRAMIEGERVLKHYQATHSREAIRLVLRGMRAALDSPAFVNSLGGGDSLSFERARVLHRDGQFLDTVPTSHYRAIVAESRMPECLEYLYFCLKEMTGGEVQDTQVLATDACAHATRVRNANTEAFARCDMGSLCLASHHWAPLSSEIEFVTTARDHEKRIYEGPKDLLLTPWIEVNARFGRIQPR